MSKRIRFIYLSLIVPLLFVLRLYQIYMNLGINPVIVDFLREKNFLWIVLALTVYPVVDLCIRTFHELKEHPYIAWDKCFILVAAVIADIQVLILLDQGHINQTNPVIELKHVSAVPIDKDNISVSSLDLFVCSGKDFRCFSLTLLSADQLNHWQLPP